MLERKVIQVFSLSEVAAILDVPPNRIKAWTVGRPFRIVPTLRSARGTGSPNLFSLEDVYLFALVAQLEFDDLRTNFIKWVIADRRVRENFTAYKYFLVRASGGRQPELFFLPTLRLEDLKAKPNEVSCVPYHVNLPLLVKRVNQGIEKLRRRR
jgi:hypothetical protein